MSDTCGFCKRPKQDCHRPVDERWPDDARKAYRVADLTTAPTCLRGQIHDLKHIGWSWDRARFSSEWTGEVLSKAERRGRGFALDDA